MIRPNPLRDLIKAGKPTLGTRTIIPSPRVWEALAETGFYDYIEFGAHSMNWTYDLVEDFARTMDRYPKMSCHIKCVPEEREFLAPRAVDAGFQNVKFAAVKTADEVRECIRIVRPEIDGGNHGNDPRRVSQVLGDRHDWLATMKNVGVWIVIERKEVMDEIDEILTLDIDMVSMGNVDMSQSLGVDRNDPEVRKQEKILIEKAQAAGVGFRAHIYHAEEAKFYMDMGVKHFFMSQDIKMIQEVAKHLGEEMRNLLPA